MKCRRFDENGDIKPVLSLDDLADGAEAVGILAQARMNLIYGEWWEDETLGFQLVPYLIDSARSGNQSFLTAYITDYIAQTEGCVSVVNSRTTIENRHMTYSCELQCDNDSTEVEVGEDVLLSALY